MPNIFYSWQSDLDAKTNRWFIRDCLKKAIKKVNASVELENASREIELDHDTKGVPGSPPIFDTIIFKIQNADLMLCDLSPISIAENSKHCPNPNVLIEYGYALSHLEDTRMLLVINEAYVEGELKDCLPFDLQHKRHPICFNLPANADKEVFKDEGKKLTDIFITALQSACDFGLLDSSPEIDTDNEEVDCTTSFLSNNQILGKYSIESDFYEFLWEGDPHIFLKIIPLNSKIAYKDSELLELSRQNNLFHLKGDTSGVAHVRSQDGICLCSMGRFSNNPEVKTITNSVTQLFHNLTLWGMSTKGLDEEVRGKAYIPTGYLRNILFNGIQDYLNFYTNIKLDTKEFRIIAGVSGVYDYAVTVSSRDVDGHSIHPEITHHADVALGPELPEAIHEFLETLLENVFDACGVKYTKAPFK